MVEQTQMFLCSQVSARGTKNAKHAGLSLQRKRLGVVVANSLVTFVLSVWPRPHQILPLTLVMNLLESILWCHLYFRVLLS